MHFSDFLYFIGSSGWQYNVVKVMRITRGFFFMQKQPLKTLRIARAYWIYSHSTLLPLIIAPGAMFPFVVSLQSTFLLGKNFMRLYIVHFYYCKKYCAYFYLGVNARSLFSTMHGTTGGCIFSSFHSLCLSIFFFYLKLNSFMTMVRFLWSL